MDQEKVQISLGNSAAKQEAANSQLIQGLAESQVMSDSTYSCKRERRKCSFLFSSSWAGTEAMLLIFALQEGEEKKSVPQADCLGWEEEMGT